MNEQLQLVMCVKQYQVTYPRFFLVRVRVRVRVKLKVGVPRGI